jgi:hypothetical protein
MLRGEFDGRVGSLSSQLAISSMDPGKVVLQFGNKLPNVPKAVDVAVTPLQKTVTKLLRAKGELNRIVAGPPAIPKDRLEALRETFRKAHMSEQYRDFARKARRPVDDVPLVGEDVANMIKDAVEVGPELTALIKQVTLIQPKLIKHKGKVSKLENGNRKVSIMYEGKEVSAGISGSRTAVKVGGKTAKRKAIEIGMTCEFIYVRPGAEAKAVDCE